jgi:putative transposase
MDVNEIGEIAYQLWGEIIIHYPSAHLGAFVVMPNHIHSIIIIDYSMNNLIPVAVETGHEGTGHAPSQQTNTVSNMVGSFKSAVTRLARGKNSDFNWQTRFYDHIIRNQEDYDRIERYIINNPANWEKDTFTS